MRLVAAHGSSKSPGLAGGQKWLVVMVVGEEPTSAVAEYPAVQPVPDQTPGGECSESGKKVVVIDSVECRCQVRVEYPLPVRVAALAGQKDRLDRIVAASARPVSVGSRLEPRLLLRLQRVERDSLQSSVGNHWNPEGPPTSVGLGDIHPLGGLGFPGCGCPVLHPGGQLGLFCGVVTLPSHENRPGWAPSKPRGQRCSHDRRRLSGRRLPPLNGWSLNPGISSTIRGLA